MNISHFSAFFSGFWSVLKCRSVLLSLSFNLRKFRQSYDNDLQS